VFVSANLFDHQPERLAAMQCQGFVGKPIIESQLIAALETALGLEWVRDNTPRSLLPAEQEQATLTATPVHAKELPAPLREDLARLARQGHASGLQEALRHAIATHPEHTATLHFLQNLAHRFDFQTLIAQLREPDHELPAV
jgi:hypothetical protein